MIFNDLDMATFTAALYADQPDGYWTDLFPHDTGYVGVKRVVDTDVVIARGSTTENDWLANFATDPVYDGRFGYVHEGFFNPMQQLYPTLKKVLGPKVQIGGHSRGAAQATAIAALLTYDGRPPERVSLWGSPRLGFKRLAAFMATVPAASYRNLIDPVTLVPFYILPSWLYQNTWPLTPVAVAPPLDDSWGPLADHHFSLYHTAMQAIFQPTVKP